MGARVMFYVQHVLGVGHLKRASIIAQAMVDAALEVTVVLGGMDVPGIDFDGCARIRLPAIRAADGTFSSLVDEHGRTVDDALRDARMARLLVEFEALHPDVLLIEQFPFGRRQFRFELLPLLEAARTAAPRPRVLCSLRDVLVAKADPERRRDMVALARRWLDGVLVHGDPGLLRLEDTFPEAAEIASMIRYTGYVAAHPSAGAIRGSRAGVGEVIVSAGGGAVGAPLLQAALAARPLSVLADRPWRLITGPNLPDADFAALAWDPPAGVVVERWRDDMPTVLRNCVVSISQGGYNTVMDILQAGARAVIVPFAAKDQTEQAFRARTLAAQRAIIMLEWKMLEQGAAGPAEVAQELAQAIGRALTMQPRSAAVDMNGARETARAVAACAAQAPF
ncbi:MAG: glycosyl transferase [Rhodospirillales bacterium]|nr:glycosyl transferase [Rhodospirillales bacterium]